MLTGTSAPEPEKAAPPNYSDQDMGKEKDFPILKSAQFVNAGDNDAEDVTSVVSEVISQCTTIFALGTAIPILYGSCMWFFLQMYSRGAISLYLVPLMKSLVDVQTKDVANFTVLIMGILTFGFSSFVSTVAKAASEEGLDYGTTRFKAYQGIVLRIATAHQECVNSFPLLAAAVILSSQAGVSQAIRSQFTVYALLAHIIRYMSLVAGRDFLRTVAHASFLAPCVLLLVASAVPGFSKSVLHF
ncbi:hypothetical protein BDR26DRAFT_852171 [Obelidium mucronatum]|nr:hypothetical protein BDR26DRAFT_852171 [Obelidium mucronatum]